MCEYVWVCEPPRIDPNRRYRMAPVPRESLDKRGRSHLQCAEIKATNNMNIDIV